MNKLKLFLFFVFFPFYLAAQDDDCIYTWDSQFFGDAEKLGSGFFIAYTRDTLATIIYLKDNLQPSKRIGDKLMTLDNYSAVDFIFKKDNGKYLLLDQSGKIFEFDANNETIKLISSIVIYNIRYAKIINDYLYYAADHKIFKYDINKNLYESEATVTDAFYVLPGVDNDTTFLNIIHYITKGEKFYFSKFDKDLNLLNRIPLPYSITSFYYDQEELFFVHNKRVDSLLEIFKIDKFGNLNLLKSTPTNLDGGINNIALLKKNGDRFLCNTETKVKPTFAYSASLINLSLMDINFNVVSQRQVFYTEYSGISYYRLLEVGDGEFILPFNSFNTSHGFSNSLCKINLDEVIVNSEDIDNSKQLSANVFPNPTTEKFTILSKSKIDKVKVFNANISKISSFQIDYINDNEVSVSGLQNGMYFIRIHQKGNVENKMVVVCR